MFTPAHCNNYCMRQVCADGSFTCALFALLRGPLVYNRIRGTRSRLGQRDSMLIPTSARMPHTADIAVRGL